MSNRFSRRAALSAAALSAIPARISAQDLAHHATPVPTPLGPAIPPELIDRTGNWVVAQGDLAGTRVARGSAIDVSNAASLDVAWSIPLDQTGGYGAMTANPIVIGDTIFAQTMQSDVWAVDLETGAIRWRHDVGIGSIGPNGVAAGYGMIVAAAGDSAEVFALDAESGRELWRVRLSNNPFEGIDMAPAIYANQIFVSTVAGNNTGFNIGGTRGVLFVLDAATGATLWQFDTTTGNLWGNPTRNAGGGLWYPPSFDDAGHCYFGTANAAPWPGVPGFPNGSSRPGPNDFCSSMVSLDGRTGEQRWNVNASPHDLFDHDFQNTPVLVDITVDDVVRPAAIGSGKCGRVIAVDRDTGAQIWTALVGVHRNDDLTQIPEGALVDVTPGAWGGVLTPIACDGDQVIAAVNNKPTTYSADGHDRASMFDLSDGSGEVVALDAGSGQRRWTHPLTAMTGSGATIVNDVVFAGTLDGTFLAVDSVSGAPVWSFTGPSGLNAPCAVAGDVVVVPFGGLWTSQPGSAAALICFKLRHT